MTIDEKLATLTDRQREVYREIVAMFAERKGTAPTIREIGRRIGVNSPNGVMCNLKPLEKKGLIERDPKSARSIRLVDADRCPHCGKLPTDPVETPIIRACQSVAKYHQDAAEGQT